MYCITKKGDSNEKESEKKNKASTQRKTKTENGAGTGWGRPMGASLHSRVSRANEQVGFFSSTPPSNFLIHIKMTKHRRTGGDVVSGIFR